MRRIIFWLVLLVLALSVEGVGYLMRPDAPPAAVSTGKAEGEAETATGASGDEQAVFCQSIVIFTLPQQRWTAYIKYPGGGTAMLEESIRRLPQDEVPNPWPVPDLLDHYEVVHTACFESWATIFSITDDYSLGSASRKLENPYVITERDMRRAVLKVYFKDAWQQAEALFPLQGK